IQHAEDTGDKPLRDQLETVLSQLKPQLDPVLLKTLQTWPDKVKKYREPVFRYAVRGKELSIKTHTTSLSHTEIPKIAMPRYQGWGDILRWYLRENVPGEFPYTSGTIGRARVGRECSEQWRRR